MPKPKAKKKAKTKAKAKPRFEYAKRVREIALAQAEIERDRLLVAGMRQALEARDAATAEAEAKFNDCMVSLTLLIDKLREKDS